MKRALGALGLAAWALHAHPAMAQQEIQWKQTVNMPKGANMPPGVKAEILGIEMGETYAESKPKLAALAAEDVRKVPTGFTPTQQYLNESSGVASMRPAA